MKESCAYCERAITARSGRLRSTHTGEIFCLRTDCMTVGKRIRSRRKKEAASA